MAESLRLEYRHRLALAKEQAGEIKAATYLRNFNRVQAQKRIHRNIRVTEKTFKGGSTSKVVVTSSNGSIKEYNTKEPMEKVIAVSNECKWHQTETKSKSDLLKLELIDELGLYGEGEGVK